MKKTTVLGATAGVLALLAACGPAATSTGAGSAGTTVTTPALPAGSVTDTGTLLVGTDITAGTYRGLGCQYWARLKDANGDLDSILANGNTGPGELLTVTIVGTDYAFQNSCASLQPIASVPAVADSGRSTVLGTLVVGKDIQPGTWSGTAVTSCYWARLSGFTGGLDDVLANDNVGDGEKFTVKIKPSDKGFQVGFACGPLTKTA